MLAAAAAFVLSLGIILGIYWLFVVWPEIRTARALLKRVAAEPEQPAAQTSLTKKAAPLSTLKFLDGMLARSGHLLDPIQRSIKLSGLRVTIGTVVLASGFMALLVGLAITMLTSQVLLGAVCGSLGAFAPFAYIGRMATKRRRILEEQFPQAVDLIAVSLRAGHAFTTGLLMVAEEIDEPLGAEFRLVYDQQNYGRPLPEVLKALTERVPLLDVRIFVTAVLTQRETGGNLAELLDRMSSLIRERFRVRRQVRALSAHGRITGLVLSLLPGVLAGVLFLVVPDHMTPLIEDPLGIRLVVIAIVLQILGVFTIRQIVNIEY
jgi:tight adherence protein B